MALKLFIVDNTDLRYSIASQYLCREVNWNLRIYFGINALNFIKKCSAGLNKAFGVLVRVCDALGSDVRNSSSDNTLNGTEA